MTAEKARVALIDLNRQEPPEQHELYQDDALDADYYDGDEDCQHEWELRSEHDLWVCAWCQAETTAPSSPPDPSPLDARCTCGHALGDHRAGGGVCMERDRSLPCGCQSYEPRTSPGSVESQPLPGLSAARGSNSGSTSGSVSSDG